MKAICYTNVINGIPKAVRNLSPRTIWSDLSAAKSCFSCDDTDAGDHQVQDMWNPGV